MNKSATSSLDKYPRTITLEGIDFIDSTAVVAGLLTFKDRLDKGRGNRGATEIVKIGEKTILDVCMGYYILSYESSEQANLDVLAFRELYRDFYSEKNKIAILPRIVTIFDYKGLTHIRISIEEKVDFAKGLIKFEYQGFIVNPVPFLETLRVKNSVNKLTDL